MITDSERHAVNDVAALARDAAMSSSYKPALLKALVRVVQGCADSEIAITKLGAEFVKLYWVQTVVFRLRQAASVSKEPNVVRSIRYAAEAHRARKIEELPSEVLRKLERDMAGFLKINVLELFHRGKPATMAPLFHWTRGSQAIHVPAAAAAFIGSNAGVLQALANLWWARYLEKVNLLAPLVIEKIERNGAERSSLGKYLYILRQIDEQCCFYCGRDLARVRSIHVDHVIPWSFLLANPLWDLVLACSDCNLAKSDTLPRPEYLDRLATTGLRRAKIALPRGFASPMLPRDEIDRYYEAALSVEWPSGWSPESVA